MEVVERGVDYALIWKDCWVLAGQLPHAAFNAPVRNRRQVYSAETHTYILQQFFVINIYVSMI